MKWFRLLLLVLIPTALTVRIQAHHAFAAEFDARRPVMLSGKIVKLTWLNPHARFTLLANGPSGQVTWEFVLGSPNVLMRQGWSRSTLKEGDVVTVNGYLAKDGSHTAAARLVLSASGQKLFFGSNGDGGPDK